MFGKIELSGKGGIVTQVPSVGQIVHYVSHGTPVREDGTQVYTRQCRAADITEVDRAPGWRVGLMVKNPTGLLWIPLAYDGSDYDSGEGRAAYQVDWSCDGLHHHGGTWHWPARIE